MIIVGLTFKYFDKEAWLLLDKLGVAELVALKDEPSPKDTEQLLRHSKFQDKAQFLEHHLSFRISGTKRLEILHFIQRDTTSGYTEYPFIRTELFLKENKKIHNLGDYYWHLYIDQSVSWLGKDKFMVDIDGDGISEVLMSYSNGGNGWEQIGTFILRYDGEMIEKYEWLGHAPDSKRIWDIVDLNDDGIHEVLVELRNEYPVFGNCSSCYIQPQYGVYAWKNGRLVDVSSSFPNFYDSSIKPASPELDERESAEIFLNHIQKGDNIGAWNWGRDYLDILKADRPENYIERYEQFVDFLHEFRSRHPDQYALPTPKSSKGNDSLNTNCPPIRCYLRTHNFSGIPVIVSQPTTRFPGKAVY